MADWRTESRFSHQVEQERRLNGIKYLFDAWGLEPTREQARIYLLETKRIPFYWFRLAVRQVIAVNRWAKPPRVADIALAAENLAGMDRQRYYGGNYLPCETEWPPDGQRYAINMGEFEPANRAQLTTGPATGRPVLESGPPPTTDEVELF